LKSAGNESVTRSGIGTVIDPFGHKWSLATHVEEVPPQELQRRMEEWSKTQAGG
jgi:PhnB protein